MMKTMLALATLALLAQDDPKLEAFKKAALSKEVEGVWKRIDWQKSPEEALKKSQAEGKPLLVVLIVGHLAQKGAAEC